MIRKSTGKALLLTLIIAALVSTGYAQAIIKIGVVDSQKVLQESEEGKKVMSQLQDMDKRNSAEVSRRDEEIRNLQTKLNTQRLTLTQEAIINLTSDLETKTTARKRFAEDTYKDMQNMTQRMFQKIQGELLPIIEKLGKERGLDIIFDLGNSGAVYYSSTIDVTLEVIKRYDASKT